MLKTNMGAGVGAALLLLSACGEKKAQVPTVNLSMTEVMKPAAETLWDTVSKAYNDVGDALVPSKLTEADWTAMADASAKMKERALLLAGAEHIVVADDGHRIMGEQAVGVNSAAGPEWAALGPPEIQKRIDADRKLFSRKAQDLADRAELMHRAATTKDAKLLYESVSGLDETCDSCHEPFWGTDEPPPFPKSFPK